MNVEKRLNSDTKEVNGWIIGLVNVSLKTYMIIKFAHSCAHKIKASIKSKKRICNKNTFKNEINLKKIRFK